MKKTYQIPQTERVTYSLRANVLQTLSGKGPGMGTGGGTGMGE